MIIKRFTPNYMVDKIYNIDPKVLKRMGVRTVLSDLDNTLIAWNNPDGTPELKKWLKQLETVDIQLIVVSNNTTKRVHQAVAPLGVKYVSWSLKPLRRGLRKALKTYHLDKTEVVMVGDQLMTDIWAANMHGIKSIWVKPMINSDSWQTLANRWFERHIYHYIKQKQPDLKWEKKLIDRNRD